MSAATDEYNDIRKLQQTIADRDAEIARLKDECKDIYDRNVEIVTEFYPLRSRLEAAEKEAAISGNYVADRECEPRSVTFTNGRIVRVVGEGYLEVERT